MPASVHRPKVARCVQHVLDKDKSGDKGKAIRICQASIGESYHIPKTERAIAKKGGKALKALRKEQAKTKADKLQARRDKMGWNVAELVETLNSNPEGCNQYKACAGGKREVHQSAEWEQGLLSRVAEHQSRRDWSKVPKDIAAESLKKLKSDLQPYFRGKANNEIQARAALSKASTHDEVRDAIKKLSNVTNGFCPTGKGGGRDNSCHGAGGKLSGKADERRRKLRRLWERAKTSLKSLGQQTRTALEDLGKRISPKDPVRVEVVSRKRLREVTRPVKRRYGEALVTSQRLAVNELIQILKD